MAIKAITDHSVLHGPGSISPDTFHGLWRTLEDHTPFIEDPEVRDRLEAASQVAYVAGLTDPSIKSEGLERGRLCLKTNHLLGATSRILIKAIRGEQPGPWDWLTGEHLAGEAVSFPSAVEAGAWVREQSRDDLQYPDVTKA